MKHDNLIKGLITRASDKDEILFLSLFGDSTFKHLQIKKKHVALVYLSSLLI